MPRRFGPLALIVALALALRIGLIFTPWGWLEADEAIVGLMALHILEGDRPIYYWGQNYLGALEAYSAAALFSVFGVSTFALKLVPAVFSTGFVALSYLLAHRLFGRGPAILTGVYLAVPPSMLALWSIKSRGGYAEVLFLGQAVLLLALAAAQAARPFWWTVALGLVAGVAFWTNQLAAIYLVPAAVYLVFARKQWPSLIAPGMVGFLVGASPMLIHYLTVGFDGPAAASGNAAPLWQVPHNLLRLWRVGIPVLLGMAQPTSDVQLWLADWPTRPASVFWVALGCGLLVVSGVLAYWRSLVGLIRRHEALSTAPALLVGVFAAAILILPFTRFNELVSEPRYALPLYSTIPLFAALGWRLRARIPLFVAVVALVLVVNLQSLATFDPMLGQPTTDGASTPTTRAELGRFLVERDLTRIYADYWLAYPLAFETREAVIPAVASNGFNRFAPYTHLVFIAERPAFVLVAGRPEEAAFYARMAEAGATATVETVSIYEVVYDVEPLEAMRP